MLHRKLKIFISHPSRRLTDHQPFGDGLVAWEFVSRLARRGHFIHVAAGEIHLAAQPPSNLILHQYPLKYRSLQPFEAMYRIRRVFRVVSKTITFDIIHQLNPVVGAMSGLLLCERVPLVLGPFVQSWPPDPSHKKGGPKRRGILERWLRFLARRIDVSQKRAAAALVASNFNAACLLRPYDPHNSRTRTISLGVDTTRFFPCFDESQRASPQQSILFLANLNVRKGIYTLLEAFERVSEAFPSCRLIVAGDGAEREGVRKRIESMKSKHMISTLGPIERERVSEVLRSSTLYCLPSYGDPFPASALEAMACGKPLVVTDGGGLGNFVDDPQGGRKVPMRDSAALSAALIEMLNCSPETLDSTGRYNRDVAVKRYEWESVVDRLERVYEEVIAADGRPSRAAGDF